MKLSPFALATLLLFGTQSCHQPASQKAQDGTDSVKTETPQQSKLSVETLTLRKDGPQGFNVSFNFVVDYPVQGPDLIVKAIKENILESFGDYKGNDDSQKGLQLIADHFVSHSVNEINKLYESEERKDVNYSYEGSIKMFENTSKYVTYNVDYYLYTGGAHGMPCKYYFTIEKETGKLLEWNDIIDRDKLESLSKEVKKAIEEQYYKGKPHNWDDVFQFALPEQTPTITADGLLFNYASYEIDCYAAGMPHCTLPYEIAEKYMTPKALTYIK